jgi:mono/diheme cytochrome c family protein
MLHRSTPFGMRLLISLILLAVLVWATAVSGATSDTVTFTLPAGDPEAGRTAFVALSCTSCHGVSGENGFPGPVSANRGPTLGAYQGQQTPERLARSIVFPSHEISANVRDTEGSLSPMGDFSEAMTVRQFLDIIAYIRSLETGAHP